MTGLLGAALVETLLVTWRAVTQGGIKTGPNGTAPVHAPLPSLYTSVILVYGGLAILPKSFDPVPALVGWGFVVATFLNVLTPGGANAAAASSAGAVTGITNLPPMTPGTSAGPRPSSS